MPRIGGPDLRPWLVALGLLVGVAAPARPGPIEDRLADALGDLDARELETGVLYDRVLPLSGIERFAGDERAAVASRRLWGQLYEELRRASADPTRRPPVASVFERTRHRAGVVPLAVIFDRYEHIRADALDRGALALRDGHLVRGAGEAFQAGTAFAAAALREWTYRGGEVAFVLERDDYFSNRAGPAPRLEADLGDGLGFRPVAFGVPLPARYARTGDKSLRLRATTADGEVLQASFAFAVRALAAPSPNDTIPLAGTIPYLGGVATGEAYVYLAQGRTELVNPAVVVEGFDLDNSMNWDELYALLNQEQLIETLRADGYDAVVLNFTDATDYLQRNAFVLVDLLDELRATLGTRTVALAGASMGGLVSRHALAYLEANALPHSVRTFISFDAPHLGADIPLGIQYWTRFFATQSVDAANLLSLLDRPAARQMLVYHYTDPPDASGQPDPLRGAFTTELAALGDFPTQPRLVAIVNGSGAGTGQAFSAGAQLVEWNYNSAFFSIVGNVWAVSGGSSSTIFDGRIRILFSDMRQTVIVSGTQPYDNAPGGSRATMAQMDAVPAPVGDIIALFPSHCFIPTVSALAFDTGSLFHDVLADPDPLAHTPFDAIYAPVANQEHVAITPENAAWIRDEVERGVTAVAPAAGASLPLGSPWPNPSSGPVRIAFTLARTAAVDLRVLGVDGREVARLAQGAWGPGTHEVAWHGRDARGAAVPAGVYFVRLAADGIVAARRMVRLR